LFLLLFVTVLKFLISVFLPHIPETDTERSPWCGFRLSGGGHFFLFFCQFGYWSATLVIVYTLFRYSAVFLVNTMCLLADICWKSPGR